MEKTEKSRSSINKSIKSKNYKEKMCEKKGIVDPEPALKKMDWVQKRVSFVENIFIAMV